MRYVQRDENGRITGHFANPQPGVAEELLEENHPDLLAYSQPQLTLGERMNAIYAEQPVEVRARFGPLKASIKTFLEQAEPDIAATRYLIEAASISAEDESLRQQLLDCLPGTPEI